MPRGPRHPLRMRAVWARRQALQPPLRSPGAKRLSRRRSASGSHGTVSLRSRTTAALRGFRARLCPAQGNRTRGGGRRHRAADPRAARKRQSWPATTPPRRPRHSPSPAPSRTASPSPSRWCWPARHTAPSPRTCPAPSGSIPSTTPPSARAPRNTSSAAPTSSATISTKRPCRSTCSAWSAAYVGSAYGAAQFYGTKVTQARDLTVASQNDDRDEDRDGVAGFESNGERARLFAAEMGLQAYALMAAAEGAVHAYAARHRRGLEALRGALRPEHRHGSPVRGRRTRRLRVRRHGGGREVPAASPLEG